MWVMLDVSVWFDVVVFAAFAVVKCWLCLVDYGHTVWSLGGVVCGGLVCGWGGLDYDVFDGLVVVAAACDMVFCFRWWCCFGWCFARWFDGVLLGVVFSRVA